MDTLVLWIFVMLFVVSSCQYPKSRENNYPKFPNYRETKIVKQESNIGLPNYNFSYETSDGSRREEAAVLKDTGNKKEAVLAVSGSYTYVGTDGVTYKITYVADENGYRASGEHLPTNKQ
ncbi:endocuticle structural glycoprotein ABD-5-like [Diorhabda sublineata]|uniref:endocuticle structural glycoprotein ABD-5-like n=1 Tax=Diorhabda sublineata TaxID=1163346 RepID=UPI0024E0B1F9|nr:endocuticle structural glycoprotein ABD-5-like [Diorhabda sublineata]